MPARYADPDRALPARPAAAARARPGAALYRVAAVAGAGSALVLLVNAAKRGALIPTTDLTQLLAPLAEIMALALVTGLFFAFGRRAGRFATVAFVLNFAALAALVGVETVINLVFAELAPASVADLIAGPLGVFLAAVSMLFLVGTLAFTLSLGLAGGLPRTPLVLYLAGALPIAFRAFVPELVLDLGLATLAAAVAWLAAALWTHAREGAPPLAAAA